MGETVLNYWKRKCYSENSFTLNSTKHGKNHLSAYIIPDPQTHPSSLSLKPAPQTKPSKTGILKGPAPHDWPSISSANPQELWLS